MGMPGVSPGAKRLEASLRPAAFLAWESVLEGTCVRWMKTASGWDSTKGCRLRKGATVALATVAEPTNAVGRTAAVGGGEAGAGGSEEGAEAGALIGGSGAQPAARTAAREQAERRRNSRRLKRFIMKS
jgi:hypothetical protein